MFNRISSWFKQDFFRKLIKNSSTLLTGSIGGSLIGLVSFTLTLRAMGSHWYGVFVVIQTYVQIFDTIFNFQCWQAMVKFGSKTLEDNDYKGLKEFIKIGTIFDVSSAFLGALAGFILIPVIGQYLDWNETQILIGRIYSCVIVFHITGTPIGVLRLLGKFKYIATHRVVGSFIKMILVVTAYFIQLDFFPFAIVLIVAEAIDNTLLVTIAYRTMNKNNLSGWYKASTVKWKEFFKFGFWTNIESTLNIPVLRIDKLLIARYLSYEMVSFYKILGQFRLIIKKVLNSMYYSVFPEFARMVAKGKKVRAFKDSVKLGIIILGVGLPLCLIAIFTSSLWFPPIFGIEFESYMYIFYIYLLYRLFVSVFVTVDPLFVSLGYVKYKFFITVFINLLYLGLAFYLGLKFGLLGFVLADLIQNFTGIFIKIFLIYKKNSNKEKSVEQI